MTRTLAHAGRAAVALAAFLAPLGAATASAGPPIPAPATGYVDQPLDHGPAGTVPTGRIAPPPSDAEQQDVLSRPVTPAGPARLLPNTAP